MQDLPKTCPHARHDPTHAMVVSNGAGSATSIDATLTVTSG